MKKILSGFGVVVALSLLASCAQKEDETASTSTAVYKVIDSQNCVQCHQPGGSATSNNVTLNFLNQADAYSGLVTKTQSGTIASACSGAPLVVANSVASSYSAAILIAEFASNNFGRFGCAAPYSTHSQFVNLSSSEAATFKAWITAGAPNN